MTGQVRQGILEFTESKLAIACNSQCYLGGHLCSSGFSETWTKVQWLPPQKMTKATKSVSWKQEMDGKNLNEDRFTSMFPPTARSARALGSSRPFSVSAVRGPLTSLDFSLHGLQRKSGLELATNWKGCLFLPLPLYGASKARQPNLSKRNGC